MVLLSIFLTLFIVIFNIKKMKKIIILLVSVVFISSCISKKEHAALQSKHNKTKDELLAVKNSLTKCVIDNEKCDADVANLNNIIADLKNDKKLNLDFCDDQPIAKHYVIGQKLGISGTPAIITPDGELIPGYVSPEELLSRLKA